MPPILEAESRLTDRYQTTVPSSVRRALSLEKRDKLRFVIRSDGQVTLSRAVESDADDPALGRFLDFLATDMARHPERLQALDAGLAERIKGLTGDFEVDLDHRWRTMTNESGWFVAVGRQRLDAIRSPAIPGPA